MWEKPKKPNKEYKIRTFFFIVINVTNTRINGWHQAKAPLINKSPCILYTFYSISCLHIWDDIIHTHSKPIKLIELEMKQMLPWNASELCEGTQSRTWFQHAFNGSLLFLLLVLLSGCRSGVGCQTHLQLFADRIVFTCRPHGNMMALKTEMKCVLGDFYQIIKYMIQVYSKPI